MMNPKRFAEQVMRPTRRVPLDHAQLSQLVWHLCSGTWVLAMPYCSGYPSRFSSLWSLLWCVCLTLLQRYCQAIGGWRLLICLCVRTVTPSRQHLTNGSSESAIVMEHAQLLLKIHQKPDIIGQPFLGCFASCQNLLYTWKHYACR